jgi:copper chaperone CopZ
LSPDAGTPRTRRRDTRPCTAGWRFAQLPASARSKRERLETRDTRHSKGQDLRQSERAGIPENTDVFSGSPPLDRGTCGISPVGAENPPVGIEHLSAHPSPVPRPPSMPGVMKSVGLRYSGMNNPQRDDASAVQTTTLSIAGMSCDACVHHVRRALDGVPGVVHVEVNLRHNRATIEHLPRQASATVLAAAVQDAGYQARIAPSIGDSDSAPSRVGPPAACGCGCCADPRKSVDRSWDLGTSTIG